jgi:hypothetical protein
MRKVIRKRIRHTEDGLDLAVDLNSDVAINVGSSRSGQVRDAGAGEDRQPVEDRARPDGNDDGRKES